MCRLVSMGIEKGISLLINSSMSQVSGLDRSWQRPAGVAAKLIDCKSSKGLYYIEYSLQKPGESCKHLFSALGMANNGWYNRLYTVTGQVQFPRPPLLYTTSLTLNAWHWRDSVQHLYFRIHSFLLTLAVRHRKIECWHWDIFLQFVEEDSDKYSSKIEKVSLTWDFLYDSWQGRFSHNNIMHADYRRIIIIYRKFNQCFIWVCRL